MNYKAGDLYRKTMENVDGYRLVPQKSLIEDPEREPDSSIYKKDFVLALGLERQGLYGKWIAFFNLRSRRISWIRRNWFRENAFHKIES